ncbi:MAG: chromate transporter [Oscillospiraceae bacterium]|nr:chromate transporter [Oscillospiraceae bacterium]
MKKLLTIFLTFMKIGTFTFGGGYAMIPLIQKETVEKYHWITDEDLLNVVAIAESTPGPIAINAATFVGYHVAGYAGAVVATLGVVLPSFAIILALSGILQRFGQLKPVIYAFNGIRVGVFVLLGKALWKMFRTNRKGGFSYFLMGLSFVLTAVCKVNTFLVILLCGVLGLAFAWMAERRMGK